MITSNKYTKALEHNNSEYNEGNNKNIECNGKYSKVIMIKNDNSKEN